MKLQEFEQVLVDGGRSELIKLGNCKYCVVVDWRDGGEQVLEAVSKHLPKSYLQVRQIDEENFEIGKQGTFHRLNLPEGTEPELLLKAINRLLLPDYEMRIFMSKESDTYSLLLRPTSWWNDFATTYPSRLRKLFQTIDERIQQTGVGMPRKKSWWERLIGKRDP